MATTPLLSIGMIFKNEERCLERCMRSLQPLRDAIPCELVMADTGATDASRGIAEKYADEVFDFPWIKDFSAARNAVMDRCTGKWYLTVDCDEWLDEDISELVAFLKKEKQADFACVIQRNYSSKALENGEEFNDFRTTRMVRMSTGERYHGVVHESWLCREPISWLNHTILHHDGYIYGTAEAAKKKAERNMELLRRKLEDDPDNLLTLNQCIESGKGDPDYIQYVRRAVKLVLEKHGAWKLEGSSILRNSIATAYSRNLPEFDEWLALAETLFPHSIFTQVDVSYIVYSIACKKEEWARVARYGEIYRKGLAILNAKPLPKWIDIELGRSSLYWENPAAERAILVGLANAYLQCGQGEQALQTLVNVSYEKLLPDQLRNALVVLSQLHAQTMLDVAPVLESFYERISQQEQDENKQKARIAAFDSIAAAAFVKEYREEEQKKDGWHQPAYTAFRCLAGQCEAGRAAAILMTDDPAEIREWLLAVEDWQALPIEALEHVLQVGVAFPPREKTLNIEVLDGLAARLTHADNPARRMACALSDGQEYPDLQSLYWAQSLVLASLRTYDWKMEEKEAPVSKFACPEKGKEKDTDERPACTPEEGLALIRRFAQVEALLLRRLYAPQMLAEETAALLPPMHRWGYYCSRALDALDGGNPQEYLALLRKGLKACPGEKNMVQFLLDRFMEDARPKASPELLALAERVRTILAAYDPNDPAVAAIRESAAYKQVAWLIEPEPATQLPQ